MHVGGIGMSQNGEGTRLVSLINDYLHTTPLLYVGRTNIHGRLRQKTRRTAHTYNMLTQHTVWDHAHATMLSQRTGDTHLLLQQEEERGEGRADQRKFRGSLEGRWQLLIHVRQITQVTRTYYSCHLKGDLAKVCIIWSTTSLIHKVYGCFGQSTDCTSVHPFKEPLRGCSTGHNTNYSTPPSRLTIWIHFLSYLLDLCFCGVKSQSPHDITYLVGVNLVVSSLIKQCKSITILCRNIFKI